VERLLGEGGMGAVYEGRHAVVGKRVAIKMLHAEFAANTEVLKRFYREAQAAAAIGHRNIIDVVDVGVTPANEPYLVMEYLEGEDLQSMLERTGPMSVEAACGILEPALQALGAAHAKGIVHRDLKPANIFLCHGAGEPPTVKLIDFGISKMSGVAGNTKLTQTGSLLGTPSYMSPEQARGGTDVDHRTDLYAMGVILYQMLTGQLPFRGDNYNALLISVLTEAPKPMRELNAAIPADVDAMVLKELSKDPAARSQSAGEMLAAFGTLAAFQAREAGMTMIGSRIHRGVAGGDLGGPLGAEEGEPSASRVLSEMARGTPGAWSGTAARGGPPRTLVVGLVAAAVVIAGVVAVVLVKGTGGAAAPVAVAPIPARASAEIAQPAAPEPAPAAAPAEKDRVVQIRVVGAPEGAEILFDGAVVPVNPFPVEPQEALVKLEVRAPGYEAFATMIAPSADREVPVSLKRESRKVKDGAKAPAPAHAPAPPDDGFKDGKRGTKFGKEFE
jgi:serine/threonine-protein kinase